MILDFMVNATGDALKDSVSTTGYAADIQLVVPNYVGRVKLVDGALRPTLEQRFDPSLTPAPSPLCKM